MNIGRNDPCHCASGKKYKKCCLPKDEAARATPIAGTGETAPRATPNAGKSTGATQVPGGKAGLGRIPTRKHILPRRV